MKSMCIMMGLMLLTAGCGNRPNGAADIRMVVCQSGIGFLPMPPQTPLRWPPQQITAQTDIAAILDAVDHPDGKAFTRFARNTRLAFVRKNGQVVMYGIARGGLIGCDIAPDKSSKKLSPALMAALTQAQIVKLTLASPIKSLSYHDAGGATKSASTRNQALQELLGYYSPIVLKGNHRCKASEIQKQVKRTPRFLTVKLAKPDTFDAIVWTKESEWPPNLYDTNSRLEKIRFDTITIFSESNGLSRFVFTDTQSGECLFTDPVRSLKLVKEAIGRNPPVYGPDLFEEVVSTLTK